MRWLERRAWPKPSVNIGWLLLLILTAWGYKAIQEPFQVVLFPRYAALIQLQRHPLSQPCLSKKGRGVSVDSGERSQLN